MHFRRVWAVTLRHLYLWRHSLGRLTDTFYGPLISLFIWGYVSVYFTNKTNTPNLIEIFLGGLIFWIIIQRSQQEISVNLLEDGWNKNLINIFASPISIGEYLVGLLLTSLIKVILGFVVISALALALFQFNILRFGIFLPLIIVNLLLTGWWMGFLTCGLVMRFGHEMEALSWTIIFLLQPFVGVFYPLSVLPQWMQTVARLMPPSYIFEGLRALVFTGYFDWRLWGISLGLNAVFIILTLFFYKRMFDVAREKGYLVKPF
jgi:ABC-2 type transport system permease protein